MHSRSSNNFIYYYFVTSNTIFNCLKEPVVPDSMHEKISGDVICYEKSHRIKSATEKYLENVVEDQRVMESDSVTKNCESYLKNTKKTFDILSAIEQTNVNIYGRQR